ncbi:MAG: ABC transporter permease [Pseudomonadota bacterium]
MTLVLIRRRLLAALPSLFFVLLLTFMMSRALPGDPAAFFAGPSATEASVQEIREKLGLDRSVIEQFGIYLSELVQGDLGTSLNTGQPVLLDLMQRLPASMELTLFALLFAVLVGMPLGVWAAVKPGSLVDHLCRGVSTISAAFPGFFIGLLLVFIFYYHLGWAPSPVGRLEIWYAPPPPVTGMYVIDAALIGDWEVARAAFGQIVLPAISLGMFALAPITRMTRASLIGVLSSEFILAARANGLSRRQVILTYALRNALLPVVNILGMIFSFLLGANVLIEQVFGWPGVGRYAVEAVITADYAAIQGFVVAMAIIYVLLNLTVDIVNTLVDPRVRYEV